MIRQKQTKAKSVPDDEVMLTFWGEEDVQTGPGTARQISKHYLQSRRSSYCEDLLST